MTIEPRPLRTVMRQPSMEASSGRRSAHGVTQSTLSLRTRKLEKDFGDNLFGRSSGGVLHEARGGQSSYPK